MNIIECIVIEEMIQPLLKNVNTVIANYSNTTHFIASIAIVFLILFSYALPPLVHNIDKYC